MMLHFVGPLTLCTLQPAVAPTVLLAWSFVTLFLGLLNALNELAEEAEKCLLERESWQLRCLVPYCWS